MYDAHSVGRIGGPGSVTRSIGVHWLSHIVERERSGDSGSEALSGTAETHECLVGRECYATAIRVSALACVVALLLSVIAGLRRERTAAERRRRVA